ncbi:hypothetical protein ACFV0T_36050 [Streptomyces sp. NPDC059582]
MYRTTSPRRTSLPSTRSYAIRSPGSYVGAMLALDTVEAPYGGRP